MIEFFPVDFIANVQKVLTFLINPIIINFLLNQVTVFA